MFEKSDRDERADTLEKDPFQKYHTVSTNLDNSMLPIEGNQESAVVCRKSERTGKKNQLPRLWSTPKKTERTKQTSKTIDPIEVSLKPKPKELESHMSDPFYMKLEKTLPKRTQQKHSKYRQLWSKLNEERHGKSVVEKSLEKIA